MSVPTKIRLLSSGSIATLFAGSDGKPAPTATQSAPSTERSRCGSGNTLRVANTRVRSFGSIAMSETFATGNVPVMSVHSGVVASASAVVAILPFEVPA